MRHRIRWVVIVACSLAGCAVHPPLSGRSHKLLQLRVALGVGYMRQGQLGLARNELAQALAMNSTDAAANSAMAIVEERLNEPVKAAHYFHVGLANHPHDGSLQNNYGAFLCSQGKVRRALRHFKAALSSPLYPTPQLANLNAGVCLLKTSDKKAAVHYFHRAQALAPELAGPYYYLAKVRFEAHEFGKAQADVRQYLRLARSPEGLFLGVQIGRATGDTKFVRYCATRLMNGFEDTSQARTVEEWQRKGQLLGR